MRRGWLWLGLYIATIFVANLVVNRFGIVPVGFGLRAPAAVYVVGLAFTFRDFTQESLGIKAVFIAIVIGAALSAIVSPQLAVASGTAFLFSETADLVVYTPLRERNWLGAVLLSNVIGLTLDSLIFLWLAFHSLGFLPGQILGKAIMTLLAVAALGALRARRTAVA